MVQVETTTWNVDGKEEVGLDEVNTKNMLVNLELYKGSLDRCNLTIRLFNEIQTVK